MQFGLPQGLLSSICFVESSHNPTAIHYSDGSGDSIGICQIKLKTAQWMGFQGTAEELLEPRINIYYAAAYLTHQFTRYQNQTEKAIIAYNMGHAGQLTRTEYSDRVIKQWRQELWQSRQVSNMIKTKQ